VVTNWLIKRYSSSPIRRHPSRYIARSAKAAGIHGVDQVDSASKHDRARVIERFAPYYNELSTAQIIARGDTPTRVLISTDVFGRRFEPARCRLYDELRHPLESSATDATYRPVSTADSTLAIEAQLRP
jgi:hypothetical protein